MQGVIQEPAGFMPTRDEYAKAQRVADNLAAQLAQARAENERLSAELRTAQAGWRADQEAGAAEVARLKDGLTEMLVHHAENECTCTWCDAARQLLGVERRAALRGDPAPAHGDELDDQSTKLLKDTIAALSNPLPAQPKYVYTGDTAQATGRE